MRVLNIAFYRFCEPGRPLAELRAALRELCFRLDLRGTILLAEEGVNGFVAGAEPAVRELQRELVALVPGLAGVEFKESRSSDRPFARMLVKIKREIIPLGRPDVNPARATGPRLTARELRKWLDEGRDVVLLDTRNEYEIEHGTFRGARRLGLSHFREFPDALEREASRDPSLRAKPVVMFCTGGIRCEKATAAALTEGFSEVYQLEGGILKYFEECGGAHYEGECFVFDQRVAVDPRLHESAAKTCSGCRNGCRYCRTVAQA